MKYFLDTEFLEGAQKEKFPLSLFRKETPNTIDLISIGIVAEDGREYYAISKDFNLKEAWNRFQISDQHRNGEWIKEYWLRDNVLYPIWKDLFRQAELENNIYSNKQTEHFWQQVDLGGYDQYFTFKSMKALIDKYGKINKEIASEIRNFIYLENKDKGGQLVLGNFIPNEYPKSELYAYYADYDWVIFCWLFGKMIDLPNGFPMYCRDLKQMLDEYISKTWKDVELSTWGHTGVTLKELKKHPNFPQKENVHNALADAQWNKKLYDFLKIK